MCRLGLGSKKAARVKIEGEDRTSNWLKDRLERQWGSPQGWRETERALEMSRDREMKKQEGGKAFTLNDWDRAGMEQGGGEGPDRDVMGGETNGKR